MEPDLFQQIGNAVQPIETLFIFGTNRQALHTVLENLQKKRTTGQQPPRQVFKVNPKTENTQLFLPFHQPASVTPASAPRTQQRPAVRFEITQHELDTLRAFVTTTEDRVLLALTDATPKQVKALRDKLQQYRLFTVNGRRYGHLRR